jgi:Domain of unknown function (DUF3883)
MATMITTSQLIVSTAGGDDFIRTKNGRVVGLALRKDLNPDAPEVIIVGRGPRRESRAKLLEQQATPVPAYMKRGVNSWEYIGEYGPYIYKTDKSTVAKLVRSRQPNSVAGGLYLSANAILSLNAGAEEESKLSNRGFPDAKTRKEIETAAVKFVWAALKAEFYEVFDHQDRNLGYDLLARKSGKTLYVEVKGTDAEIPRFFLTRNEWLKSKVLNGWQIRVVCKARVSPKMYVYTPDQAEKVFDFSAMAWECTLK